LAAFGLALGCSQLPVPPYGDGGSGSDAPPPTMAGPRQLTPLPVDTVGLAADDSGIYWTSPVNNVWVLPPATAIPIPLAIGSSRGADCARPSAPLLAPDHVLWSSSDRVLHRVRKSGGSDERLASLGIDARLAVDAGGVYWTEHSGIDAQGASTHGFIRALGHDAPAGSTPATLLEVPLLQDVSSLAARAGALYWTPSPSVATIYYSTLWTAALAALAGGDAGRAVDAPSNPFVLTVAADDLLIAYYPDRFTTGLARLPPDGAAQTIATLPQQDHGFLVGLAATDGWLLATMQPPHSEGCDRAVLQLYAMPLAGGAPHVIATGLRTAAIAAPQGIVFVDAEKRLMAIAPGDIDRIVSPIP